MLYILDVIFWLGSKTVCVWRAIAREPLKSCLEVKLLYWSHFSNCVLKHASLQLLKVSLQMFKLLLRMAQKVAETFIKKINTCFLWRHD